MTLKIKRKGKNTFMNQDIVTLPLDSEAKTESF